MQRMSEPSPQMTPMDGGGGGRGVFATILGFLSMPIMLTAITVVLVVVAFMIYICWSASAKKDADAKGDDDGKITADAANETAHSGSLVSVTLEPQTAPGEHDSGERRAASESGGARATYEYYTDDEAEDEDVAEVSASLPQGDATVAAIATANKLTRSVGYSSQKEANGFNHSSNNTLDLFSSDDGGRSIPADPLPPLNEAGIVLASAIDPEVLELDSYSSIAARRHQRSVTAAATKPSKNHRQHQQQQQLRSPPLSRRGKIARRTHSKHGVVSDALSKRQSLAYVLKLLKEGTLAACADDDPRPAPELLDENELALVKQSLGDGGPDSEADPSLLAAMHRWNVIELREAIDRFVQDTERQTQPMNPTLPLREAFDEFAPEDMEQLEEALLSDTAELE